MNNEINIKDLLSYIAIPKCKKKELGKPLYHVLVALNAVLSGNKTCEAAELYKVGKQFLTYYYGMEHDFAALKVDFENLKKDHKRLEEIEAIVSNQPFRPQIQEGKELRND